MFYAPYISEEKLIVVVPNIETSRKDERKEFHLSVHSLPEAAAKANKWQYVHGTHLWGYERWRDLKLNGTKLYRSELFSTYQTERLMGRQGGTKTMYSLVQTNAKNKPKKTRSFNHNKLGKAKARQLSHFQAVLWKSMNTLSDLMFTESMIDELIGLNFVHLFKFLYPVEINGQRFYHYDHKLEL